MARRAQSEGVVCLARGREERRVRKWMWVRVRLRMPSRGRWSQISKMISMGRVVRDLGFGSIFFPRVWKGVWVRGVGCGLWVVSCGLWRWRDVVERGHGWSQVM